MIDPRGQRPYQLHTVLPTENTPELFEGSGDLRFMPKALPLLPLPRNQSNGGPKPFLLPSQLEHGQVADYDHSTLRQQYLKSDVVSNINDM